MFRRFLMCLLLATSLVGCSSGVKLNDVPVEDRTGTVAPPTSGGTQSRVAPVDANATNGTAQGPVNVARLVYFDYDSFDLKPESQSIIEAHARFLRANAQRKVSLEGHTDERGGREYNLALGQKRAEAVRRALELLGVRDNQVEAVSFGKEKPAVQGNDESAWAQNRRAEIVYR